MVLGNGKNGGDGVQKVVLYVEKGKFTKVIVLPNIIQNMNGRADMMIQVSCCPM